MNWSEVQDKYKQLTHAVQSGIGYCIKEGWRGAEPKHLRTGIDLSKSDHGALVKLLIQKGVISEEEYGQAIVVGLKAEVDGLENLYKELTGHHVMFK